MTAPAVPPGQGRRLCLGLSGGLNRVHENPFELSGAFSHDGAAVLVADGRVVAAIEEERLNRIKHSNKFPTESIRFCLDAAGVRLEDIDRIAFYATEAYCNDLLGRIYLRQPELTHPLSARGVMRALLRQELGGDVDPSRIVFVRHHMAHAVSAFAMSGFEESLVLAIDGYGDFLSGMLGHGRGTSVTELESFPQNDSLGLFYLEVIQFLGYGTFDEYKVMGLAPYGDAAPYRDVLARFYDLLPDGGYRLHLDRVAPTLLEHVDVRKRGQGFTDQHKNLSASLQESLERIVFHVLRHRRRATGLRNLCLAGGVAHNCTMNGKLLYSGLFDDVFVQPAAHDAGCALGAALIASHELGRPAPRERLVHVYWGRDPGGDVAVERELGAWGAFLDVEQSTDIGRRTAELLAEGAVMGWVQGRSEFGPRALGNRSIVADPRPASNKDRVNEMVKKRESYRPFAPSVLEEDAHEFFDLPPGHAAFPFMTVTVNVREDKRALLGAVTHVDGTARLQTVSRAANPGYWSLIRAFGDLTGVPVLLNTSFNNNVEPIVDSTEDAVASFLTTGLDYLVVGSFIARKRPATALDWLSLCVSLPAYVRLHKTRAFVDRGRLHTSCEIRTTYSARARAPISGELFDVLMGLDDGEPTVGALLDAAGVAAGRRPALVHEVGELWAQRMLRLRSPAGRRPDDGFSPWATGAYRMPA